MKRERNAAETSDLPGAEHACLVNACLQCWVCTMQAVAVHCSPETIISRPYVRGSLTHAPGHGCGSCSSLHQQTAVLSLTVSWCTSHHC
eukprot:scaffold63239_cov16-Tisochrysis_lutea.AAC.1